MGVMGRANQKLSGGGGDWLDKDELIRTRCPMAIVDVRWDAVGTAKFPGANWILDLEPWDAANFPGPTGSLRFKALPTRQAQFEDLDHQLEESIATGVSYIGPIALVSGVSKGGNRYKTLADVQINEEGTVLVDPQGFPLIDDEQAAQLGLNKPAPAPVPAPTVRRASGSTGQRLRAAEGATAPPAAPAPAPAAATAAPRVSRPSTAAATAPEPAAQPEQQPTPEPARKGRRRAASAAEPPPPSPQSAQYEQAQLAQAQTQPSGVGPGIREVSTETLPDATGTCPFCKAEVTGRVYPAEGPAYAGFYAESALAFGWPPLTPAQQSAGGQVILHAHCPMKQTTVMLPVVDYGDE